MAKATAQNHDFAELLKQVKRHTNDNGSPEVQIILLSASITMLQGHLETNHHDVDAKRSLLRKVAKRRSFLRYLKDNNMERYAYITELLKLKA
ncbi:MAG: ribosomal protein [Candidatus Parcubacteria bacterium]|jgi:small subunit ribosomal protein S15